MFIIYIQYGSTSKRGDLVRVSRVCGWSGVLAITNNFECATNLGGANKGAGMSIEGAEARTLDEQTREALDGPADVAAVQLKPGCEEPPIEDLERHLRQHVYATHIPAAWRFVDTVPLNPSAKPDLRQARRLFEQR